VCTTAICDQLWHRVIKCPLKNVIKLCILSYFSVYSGCMIYQTFRLWYVYVDLLYSYLVLHPKDCSDLKNNHSKSGVYRIYPDHIKSFKVYCDMDTDGGSWTVGILNKQNKTRICRQNRDLFVGFLAVWWCLTPLSTISQLYRGGKLYWWRKLEDPEKTHQPVASHWQTLSHNVVNFALIEIRIHNISGDRHQLHR
jgi:hypothetical protein